MNKKCITMGLLVYMLFASGCVQVNNYCCDSTDNPAAFNKALSDKEVKEIYISTTQYDCRIATDGGYWYFEDASKDVWVFKDYPQRILITIRTSEAKFSEDMEDGFWWIPKNKFEGLPTEDVKFTTVGGGELYFSDNDGVPNSWVVSGFTIYKDRDVHMYLYLKASCDPRYKYKELNFYNKI